MASDDWPYNEEQIRIDVNAKQRFRAIRDIVVLLARVSRIVNGTENFVKTYIIAAVGFAV